MLKVVGNPMMMPEYNISQMDPVSEGERLALADV